MTAVSEILLQRASLCLIALRRTGDVNEAYLAVHGVISRALNEAGGPQRDLDRDLCGALNKRSVALGAMG
ncbi:MAG: hypothetical protein K2P58_12040 [Hyphomonadaceae bacterium]|nr:hypothetical protein [Hyphomonadaceae bacterium]